MPSPAGSTRGRRPSGARNGTPRSAWRPASTPSTWATSSRSASPTASASRASTGAQELSPEDAERAEYSNLIPLGEVLLGYPNAYGRYTGRPLIDPVGDPRALDLPPAEDRPYRRDLGRNGSYLVLRQLHQDVRGFWQFLDGQAGARPEERRRLAEAMVGRTRAGEPLVPLGTDPITGVGPAPEDLAANQFTYAADPNGHRCPFGAHVRRANPRTGDLPTGTRGAVARLTRMLGFARSSFRDDLIASARFHRLVRRGREYGTPLSPDEALQPGPADEERGLHFMCLVANPSRQFEFVQNAWIENTKFAGLSDEGDPLLGSRAPLEGFPGTGVFSLPAPGRARASRSTGHAAVRHGPGRRLLLHARHPRPALHRRRAVDGAHPATRARHARGGRRWSLLRLVHRGPRDRAARRAPARAVLPPRAQPGPAGARGRPDPAPHQPPAPERGPGARGGADRARRGGQPRFHHRELRATT